MQRIKQSDPRAAFRRIYFMCVDVNNLQTRLQASDMSTFTVRISKNGAAAGAAAAAAPTEIDATNAKGMFYVELAVADIGTAGHAVLVITNAGGTKTMERLEITLEVQQAIVASAITGTLTTSTFTTDRTEATTDYWKDALVLFLTGNLAGQVKEVGAYNGTTKMFTLTSGLVFTAAPANGDVFEIINR
jgi:hypothetical protein